MADDLSVLVKLEKDRVEPAFFILAQALQGNPFSMNYELNASP
jgi:hypothetical protein